MPKPIPKKHIPDQQRFEDALRALEKLRLELYEQWTSGYWPSFDVMKTFSSAVDNLFIAYCDETEQHGTASNPHAILRDRPKGTCVHRVYDCVVCRTGGFAR